uniref:THD domain-containing protein n=1 Tax=Xenopus tropicalis TaxID=8364 RepID=F7E843_XENTR
MSHMVICGSVSLARGLWGGTGAWLGVLICLIALMCQSIHIGNLQVELSLMRKSQEEPRPEVKKHHNTKEEGLAICLRQKRDLTGARRPRHHDALDATLVSWKVSMKEGRAFQVQGVNVTVRNSGIYSVYSQVLYNDSRFTMGHLITRKLEGLSGGEKVLLRCVQSMPPNESMAYNTCYSAGVFQLQKGDSISLVIPRSNANLDARGEATFLGLVRL